MSEIVTKQIKYIFIDIVGFTKERSIEAQVEVIRKLNSIVEYVIKFYRIDSDKVIFLPTGDGMAIALYEAEAEYDIHLQLALKILELIHNYNSGTEDVMRHFDVRIGLNENVDNIVIDINGRTNVAGAGINNAQRVMDVADAKQIMISEMVYETLRHREKYLKIFKKYNVQIKHGETIPVYQYLGNEPFVCNSKPQAFESANKNNKLPKLVAHYFSYCLKNKNFIIAKLQKSSQARELLIVLMWILATDADAKSEAEEYEEINIKAIGGGKLSPEAMYVAYKDVNYALITLLADYIEKEFVSFSDCIESPEHPLIINARGQQKLKAEHPALL